MIATLKSSGKKVTGKAASVFVKMGIATELKKIEPIEVKEVKLPEPPQKDELKAVPVAKAKTVKKSKRGRPAKK